MFKLKRVMTGAALAGSLMVGTMAQAATMSVFSENFDGAGVPTGWTVVNRSTPGGSTSWFKPDDGSVFPAQSGADNSYLAANFLAAPINGAANTISDWLITPTIALRDGLFTFYTRTTGFLPDRLQVRLSTNGASANVGTTTTSVGDFSTLLLDINPSLSATGYPLDWTQFSVALTGFAAATTGRIAFRYFVTDNNTNADYIGLDTVNFVVPEPGTLLLLAVGASLMSLRVRRKGAR